MTATREQIALLSIAFATAKLSVEFMNTSAFALQGSLGREQAQSPCMGGTIALHGCSVARPYGLSVLGEYDQESNTKDVCSDFTPIVCGKFSSPRCRMQCAAVTFLSTRPSPRSCTHLGGLKSVYWPS